MTVWKYALTPLSDYVTLEMPRGAKPLYVATQFGVPCIWALVRPEEPLVNRRFRIAGTGHPIEAHGAITHIGSVMLADCLLVFHVFDLGEEG